MIIKEDFLEKYHLTESDIDSILCPWPVLEEIYNDFESKIDEYNKVLLDFTVLLQGISEHKYIHQRVKNPEHLIEKIIRKKKCGINIDNYKTTITDLLACKIIYLYKTDWIKIHDWLNGNFEKNYLEKPKAYTTENNAFFFEQRNIECEIRDSGYQSVHYLVEYKGYPIEIQVRSIYQEAWGEIDHQLRYPYDINNNVLNSFSKMLSKLTNVSDELAFLIQTHKQILKEEQKIYITDSQIKQLKNKLLPNQYDLLEEVLKSNQEIITIRELLKRIDG